MLASSMKKLAVPLSDSHIFLPIIRHLENRSRMQQRLRVLAYHRIDEASGVSPYYPGLISASPAQFAAQMALLADAYHVCTLTDVVAASRGELALPADSVLLTFDDATRDFAEHAWPVLQSLGLPATVFVPTLYPDHPAASFWWDRLYRAVMRSPHETTIPVGDRLVTLSSSRQRTQVFRSLKECLKAMPHDMFRRVLADIVSAAGVADPPHNNVLSWQDLRQLDHEGVTLAPHTHTHPMLTQLPAADIAADVNMSVEVLDARIGRRGLRALAYPAGGVNDTVVEVMREQEFDVAFTTQRGVNDQTFRDPFRLRRINVGARTTLGLLRAQLANWGN